MNAAFVLLLVASIGFLATQIEWRKIPIGADKNNSDTKLNEDVERSDQVDSSQKYTGTPISFADFLAGNLSGASVDAMWLQDRLLAYKDNQQNLWTLQISDGTVSRKLLSDNSPFKETNGPQASLWFPSFTSKYISFGYDSQQPFSYSVLAHYKISLMQDGKRKIDYPVDTRKSDSITHFQQLQLFEWNPKGDDFVFVYENNIYYRSKPEDIHMDAVQITTTGTADNDNIINGVTDWLYGEDILYEAEKKTLWWSNDGRYLAFATIDNTAVRRVTFDYYPPEGLYPEPKSLPYPKVGETLPTITLSVWNKKTRKTSQLLPPPEVRKLGEFYLLWVSWPKIDSWREGRGEPVLMAVWSNRVQNEAYVSLCSMKTANCVLSYPQNQHVQNGGIWIEPKDYRLRYAAGNRYFAILPRRESDGYFYNHVATVGVPDIGRGGADEFLTSGLFEVTEILGYNAQKSLLYFTAAHPLPRQNHLFSVSTATPTKRSTVECITCQMVDVDECSVVMAHFPNDGEYYILHCEGPGVPQTLLRSVSTKKTLYAIEDNSHLRDYVATKAMSVVKYETIPLGDGYDALARILYPPGFDSADTETKYPLLQRVYAGPNTQFVQETWLGSIGFETYLASGRRYIVAMVDGRGCSGRGTKYKKPVYRNMGTVEALDQTAAASYLANRFHYIDKNRMAVWGRSYGGFATVAMVELGGHKVYQCAASVVPVTDFRLYEAAYTEKYNGLYTDQNGEEVYKKTNLITDVSNFKHINFLLVHGTADDNVHFQHSALLAAALAEHNIQFKYMVYTNEAHALSASLSHFHTLMDNFFADCLLKGPKTL